MSVLTELRVAVNAPPSLFPFYERLLSPLGVLCTPICRLIELTSMPLAGLLFHGMVVDQEVIEGASEGEKHTLGSLREIYPVLVTRPQDVPGPVVAQFAEKLRQAEARPVRAHNRQGLVMRAVLSSREDLSSPEHTLTLNVSRGGAFFFSPKNVAVGNTLWCDFPELDQPRHPVQARVCWSTSWRSAAGPPGFGVQFVSMTPETARSLQIKLVHSCLPQKRGGA